MEFEINYFVHFEIFLSTQLCIEFRKRSLLNGIVENRPTKMLTFSLINCFEFLFCSTSERK